MELIIITVAILALAGYWVYTMSQPDQKDNDAKLDRPWPYGKAVPEGKIHVKSADVAPGKSAEDRVETPAPVVTNSDPADNVPVAQVTAENKQKAVAKAKKAPAKKPAAKPAVAKKAPANKKSV